MPSGRAAVTMPVRRRESLVLSVLLPVTTCLLCTLDHHNAAGRPSRRRQVETTFEMEGRKEPKCIKRSLAFFNQIGYNQFNRMTFSGLPEDSGHLLQRVSQISEILNKRHAISFNFFCDFQDRCVLEGESPLIFEGIALSKFQVILQGPDHQSDYQHYVHRAIASKSRAFLSHRHSRHTPALRSASE